MQTLETWDIYLCSNLTYNIMVNFPTVLESAFWKEGLTSSEADFSFTCVMLEIRISVRMTLQHCCMTGLEEKSTFMELLK